MGGFLSKLAGSFGSGALAGGAGSILGGIAGIGGMIQGKKNAKLQRELARKNFELQKEYAEKNYQLQLSQQNMQADQFQTMVDLSDPSNQRAALEKAGFNPFMSGSAIGTPNTPGSSAGSIGQVSPPQYDGTGINQAAALQQQSINNAVGNLNGVLEAAEKIAGMPTNLAKGKAELTYQNILNDLGNKQNEEKLIDIARKKFDMAWLPLEKQQQFLLNVAKTANLNEQTGLFIKQGEKIEIDKQAVSKQIDKLDKEILQILAQTEGIKIDNDIKRITRNWSEILIQTQLAEIKSRIELNEASAYNQNQQGKKAGHEMNVLDSQVVRNLTPTDYMNYSFYRANASRFGLSYPDDVGQNYRTRLQNEFTESDYRKDKYHQNQQLDALKVISDASKNNNPLTGALLSFGMGLDMILRDMMPNYFGTNRHKK